MARIRTKPSTYKRSVFRTSDNTLISQTTVNSLSAKMIDDDSPLRIDKYCRNTKAFTEYSGPFTRKSNGSYEVYTGYQSADHINNALTVIFQSAIAMVTLPELEFTKNNNFELIPFLVDWDDFIRTFTVSFWKQMTYGAFEWSLKPLQSDITSLGLSLYDLLDNRFNSELAKYAQPVRFSKVQKPIYLSGGSLPGYPSSNRTKWNFEGELRLNGFISLDTSDLHPLVKKLFLLADEIGFHPDLKTIWDIIPLSFVFDYYFPLGDLLESLHPRGWFNPSWTFTGTVSLKGKMFAGPYHNITFDESIATGYAGYDVYIRDPNSDILKSYSQAPDFNWTAPSAKSLFNTAYLALKPKVKLYHSNKKSGSFKTKVISL